MKTLLVVDGNSILNRAFYGIRALTNSKGLPTNAVYGMITMLSKQVEKYKPDFAAIAFDLHAPTFRHKMYDGYKATRKGMPQELALQMPYAHKAAAALGFTVIEKEGYEADDILGSLAAKASDCNIKTLIMTGDRDSLQLINDNTVVLLATNSDYLYFDENAFVEKYGVRPTQFVDVKALMGDSSDNIPGVAGIGEKGALSLIAEFGDLDSLFEGYEGNTSVKPAMKNKLAAGRESAYLSRTLAQINCNVPQLPEICELCDGQIVRNLAYDLFTELEFNALISKYSLEASAPCVNDNEKEIEIKNGIEFVAELIEKGGCGIYIDGCTVSAFDGKTVAVCELCELVLSKISACAKKLYVYDSKTIYKLCDENGFSCREVADDVMLAAYVLDSQGGHSLDKLVTKYLSSTLSTEIHYSVYVYQLREALVSALESSGSMSLYRDIELPLSAVLADMEEAGFLIDRQGLADYGEVLTEQAEALAERIYFLAGEEFNINSPKQLGEILFEKLGLPAGKKTKTGYSTNAEILEKLAPKHPIVSDILDYRQLTKLIGTYVTGLLKVADEEGKIHTTFKQTGTATGRLSSAEPNLQNIPVKTEVGRELRKFFLPRDGYKLISADYSQIELRILACISGDERMMSAFIGGADIHTSTASAVFGVPEDEVTPLLRKRAKAVNFGIVYGIGDYSLSQDLDITVKQAKEYIDSYLSSYPAVSAYLQNIVTVAKNQGYVDTLYGRKRYIPEISQGNAIMRKFGERVAMNSPIQGTAADVIKIAMLRVSERLKAEELDAKMILQVHDELIIEASAECAERAAVILKEEMEHAVSLPVPLTVDLSIGDRWYET